MAAAVDVRHVFAAMAAKKHPAGKNAPEAIRARRLVDAMGFDSSAEFAEWLGVDPRRWNNFEVGHPFSKDIATRLVNKIPGLTYDWLFSGDWSGLPIELARRLGELPTPGGRSTRGRRPTRPTARPTT